MPAVTCCQGCTDRAPACWGRCEKYQVERERHHAAKRKAEEERKLDQDIEEIHRKRCRK